MFFRGGSRDLHDDIGQALTSVLLGLTRARSAAWAAMTCPRSSRLRLVEDAPGDSSDQADRARDRIAHLRELVVDGLRRTRQLAFELRPTVLDDIGLVPALQRLAEDLRARTDLVIELDTAALKPEERLANEMETVVDRVVKEALTNVVRHAAASTASVTLIAHDDDLRVLIEDGGIGFDPVLRTSRSHLGIEGMIERAELVGGSLSVMSAPGQGTTVLLEVPRP